jgi:hypothetical protein
MRRLSETLAAIGTAKDHFTLATQPTTRHVWPATAPLFSLEKRNENVKGMVRCRRTPGCHRKIHEASTVRPNQTRPMNQVRMRGD